MILDGFLKAANGDALEACSKGCTCEWCKANRRAYEKKVLLRHHRKDLREAVEKGQKSVAEASRKDIKEISEGKVASALMPPCKRCGRSGLDQRCGLCERCAFPKKAAYLTPADKGKVVCLPEAPHHTGVLRELDGNVAFVDWRDGMPRPPIEDGDKKLVLREKISSKRTPLPRCQKCGGPGGQYPTAVCKKCGYNGKAPKERRRSKTAAIWPFPRQAFPYRGDLRVIALDPESGLTSDRRVDLLEEHYLRMSGQPRVNIGTTAAQGAFSGAGFGAAVVGLRVAGMARGDGGSWGDAARLGAKSALVGGLIGGALGVPIGISRGYVRNRQIGAAQTITGLPKQQRRQWVESEVSQALR